MNVSSYTEGSLLPGTSNHWLKSFGDVSLYNGTLVLIATALFQHVAVFGLFFLLRGFSPKRVLDLHYLTIIFALTFLFAPLIFLLDRRIDGFKLDFFLEHEAIEVLIAIRVLAPTTFTMRRPGLVLLLCWTGLSVITTMVAFNEHYRHGADIVAWGAFFSDCLLGVSGIVLIKRWFTRNIERKVLFDAQVWTPTPAQELRRRKEGAEAMAGLGYVLHGFVTMCIGPIIALTLYDNLNPSWFAYAWTVVFTAAFFTVALSVPVTAIFFSTINWCCWHSKAVLPGESRWQAENDQELGEEPAAYLGAHGSRGFDDGLAARQRAEREGLS